jgi:hypothetical protein
MYKVIVFKFKAEAMGVVMAGLAMFKHKSAGALA